MFRDKKVGRRPRPALRASWHLARMGPRRGGGAALLLSRLALRHARPLHRQGAAARAALPIWHLSGTGALHWQDIYDGGRLVTRNLPDFETTGLELICPWDI